MKISAVALITVFGLLPVLARAQAFEYVNILNGQHTMTIQVNPPLVASGDRGVPARICSSSSGFVCVKSDLFNFAVPIRKGDLPAQWSFDGQDYVSKGKQRWVVLGVARIVDRIESTQQGVRYVFLYSAGRGLLAFSGDQPDSHATFVATRTEGFGRQ